jgi:hypothetical protein
MRRTTRILRFTPSAQRCSLENGVERPKVDRSVLENAVLLTDSARRNSLPYGDYPGRIATKRAHSRRCLGQQAAFEFESQPATPFRPVFSITYSIG